MNRPVVRIIAFATLYWVIVFAVGFGFGILRTLYLVPQIGEFRAELAESPLMVAASFLAARFLRRRKTFHPFTNFEAVLAGALAGLILLATEISLVGVVRGVDFQTYLAERSSLSTVLYFALIFAFILMPTLTRRRGG